MYLENKIKTTKETLLKMSVILKDLMVENKDISDESFFGCLEDAKKNIDNAIKDLNSSLENLKNYGR